MNAVRVNRYSTAWRALGEELGKPSAILCISAHWLTEGTQITSNEKPKTIHDFGGFPEELFQVQYPAPGDPSLAKLTAALLGVGKSTTGRIGGSTMGRGVFFVTSIPRPTSRWFS